MSTESQKCPALEIHDLIVSYQKKPVLYGVDLAVPEGSMVGVVGPNGAGKSTLIKTVMGLVSHAHGWVKVFGGELRDSIKRVGYVPQRESVDWDFPVSVMDVVLMGCYGRSGLIKRPGKMEKEKAMQALEKVGLEAYSKRQISNLSGGQQQRVFLARALAQESDLYLMDEPFAGVDAATEVAIVDLLGQIRDQGKTLIVVHHDLATAREYFDMILLLNMRVVGFGKTNDVFNSELLQKTYGGRLTVLSEIAGEVAKQER
tara:strand:+ start:1162 stop:1938 length:777 start_codon:yes stop_codon:yes gene_type:complete